MAAHNAGAPADQRERAQRRSLARHRAIAGGLLLVMVALLIGSRLLPAANFWTRLLQAGCEAAIVGGLADWFAVVALFRRPLGLPIPHTAVIPRNQGRIGAGLADFVQQHFLDPDLVAARLARAQAARRLALWLARTENANRLADRLAALLPYLLRSLGDAEFRGFVRTALSEQIAALDPVPLAGKALAALTRDDRHAPVLEHGLIALRRLIASHREQLVATVEERSRWWIPRSIDRSIAGAIARGLDELLAELADPSHPNRQKAEAALRRFIDDLQHDPAYGERLRQLQRQLLADPAVQAMLESAWDPVRRTLLDAAGQPTPAVHRMLATALHSLGASLLADPAMQARLDGALTEVARGLILPWRNDIGRFIADVVASWDAGTMTRRIELAVGADLQYIRINGTLVGALIGCALFLLANLGF